MIKVGCMSLSYKDIFPKGEMTLEDFLETAYVLRCDGVDLHTSAFPDTDEKTLRDIRRMCHRRGLAISYLAVSNNFGKTGDALRRDIDTVKQFTDIAAQMGVPLVRVFAAWLPKDEPEESVWQRLFESMREVVDYAAERDVVIGLHNHNHGCITATGEEVIRILDTIDSPYMSHILDTGQYVGSPGASGADKSVGAEKRMYDSITLTAPRAVHVRAKFYRVSSGREEWLDYPRILDILNGVGYNGWMSVVYEGWEAEPSKTAVPKAVKHLRTTLEEKGM
ncbi:MAG: sugar phosphate isomerase/epimerase [Candidatus Poribacteria bacterium]|nr:sugar phosphate isomerase/epimerase [Candidatus Poribacteria bacterium]